MDTNQKISQVGVNIQVHIFVVVMFISGFTCTYPNRDGWDIVWYGNKKTDV